MVKSLNVPEYVSDSGIKVCVIDTGYDLEHVDLPKADTNGNGSCSDTPCNWYEDPHGHGTHVAGTIAAIGDNDEGVVGVIRNGSVPLHIARALNGRGMGSAATVISGMQQCDDAGANIVNMSLGTSTFPRSVRDAFNEIIENNDRILFIAAAGNSGSNNLHWPASFESPHMMSVASVDENAVRSSFSTYNDRIDIAAPGERVLSTLPGNRYKMASGTSMASPHVAGAAALIWSHFPEFGIEKIREALEKSATDLGDEGRDDFYGHGLVNVEAALLYLGHSSAPSYTSAPTPIHSDSPSQLPSISNLPTLLPSVTPSNAPSISSAPSKAPRYCNYGFYGGNGRYQCDGIVEGGDWCNSSKYRCQGKCKGQWCKGSINTTPTSAPVEVSSTPSLNPTASPTKRPSASPTSVPTSFPTSAPSECHDNPADNFFLRMKKKEPLYKTCEWLRRVKNEKRLDICNNKTDSHGGIGPAREVCKCTCGLHSSAPTSSPETSSPTKPITKSPSSHPTSSPTKANTTSAPTRSMCCSQNFKTCAHNIGDWCHNNKKNCITCGGFFISAVPRNCIARWKSCGDNPEGCCSPGTCVHVEGSYSQCE